MEKEILKTRMKQDSQTTLGNKIKQVISRIKAKKNVRHLDFLKYKGDMESFLKDVTKLSQQGFTVVSENVRSMPEDTKFIASPGLSYNDVVFSYTGQSMPHYTTDDLRAVVQGIKEIPVDDISAGKAAIATEELLRRSPEDAKDLNTMQLLNIRIFHHLDGRMPDKTKKLLDNSVQRFMSGETTFPLTGLSIKNLSTLREYMLRDGKYSDEQIENRIFQTKERFLQEGLKNPTERLFGHSQEFVREYQKTKPEFAKKMLDYSVQIRQIIQKQNNKQNI